MEKNAVYHEADSNYCFPVSHNEVVIRLRVARTDKIRKVTVLYYYKYEFYLNRLALTMSRSYEDEDFAYYEVKLTLNDARLAYIFEIYIGNRRYYFSEDGITRVYDFNYAYYNCFQLPYIHDIDLLKEVSWCRKACFYQIFVDRFARGDYKKDDSYINMKWGDLPTPKSYAGGDLRGIINKLAYLHDLGINAIYLTPVFGSDTNHKYDIYDYYKVSEHFGTNEDLKELVGKAHELGMRIILDAVFNHASDRLPQFKDVIKNGKGSRYFDWFIIRGEKVTKEPVNYEMFASCAYMPKINTSNREAQNYFIDVAVHYIKEYHVDGWRLDVSDEVSHDFWRRFRRAVKAADKDALIVGENWHNAYPYLKGDQFDGIMNYAFTKVCLDYFAFRRKNAGSVAAKMNRLLMENIEQANNMMLNLLDTHDTHRFITEAKGNKDSLLAALGLLYVYKGMPQLLESLVGGKIVVMPSIPQVAQAWMPMKTFFEDIAKDPYRSLNQQKYTSLPLIKAELQRVGQQIYDSIYILA